MATTLKRLSWLPLFTIVGLMGCAGADSGAADGTGGSAHVSTGGAGPSGGLSSTGGSISSSSGGSQAPDGTGGTVSGTGGTPETASGGVPGTGGPVGGPGGAGGGAPKGTGGATSGGGSGVVSPPPTTGIPAGYPMPTADNVAKCTMVGLTAGLCPGGGPGPTCMQCLFGGTAYGTSETTPTAEGTMLAGNYVVSVKVGGPAAGQTYIGCESSRGLLPTVSTTAGQTLDYAFVVNVRAMEGQPKHNGGPSGYPGLDIFFSGTNPQVSGIGYALASAATKPVMVYMASDSTECDQTGNVFGGWGQMFPEFFAPPVGIANYGNSGASSNFGFWNDIKAKWTAGDWVVIQFGHNDKGVADATVQQHLESMVADAQAANVTPLLVSPPARVQFSGAMEGDQSSLHAAAAKAAAASKKVDYIDLTALSVAWYNTLGSQAAALKFHANGTDATHTNLAGAEKIAGLVAGAIKSQNIGLAKYLRQ